MSVSQWKFGHTFDHFEKEVGVRLASTIYIQNETDQMPDGVGK